MENIKGVLFLTAIALLIGVAIFFLMRQLVATRFAATHPNSYYAQKATVPDIIVSAIIVALLIGGFSMRFFAPSFWFGRFVSTWAGMISWACFLYLIARSFTLISWKLKARSQREALNTILNADPVEPWSTGVVDDKLLPDSEAYSIELFNDDTTSMPFVVNVLHSCCSIPPTEAVKHMLAIHNNGVVKVGRLSHSHAQQLVEHIKAQAAKRNFPFRCEVTPWSKASA